MEALTKDNIREFVDFILSGKGTAYRPLSRADLYTLAQFINELMNPPPKADDFGDWDEKTERNPGAQEESESSAQSDNQPSQKDSPDKDESKGEVDRNGTEMTRGQKFQSDGHSAQEAFDEFLLWTKNKNVVHQDTSVMNFSNGETSVIAAFAYWLSGKDEHEKQNG